MTVLNSVSSQELLFMKHSRVARRVNSGFTVMELLVSISIMALLASTLMFSVQNVRATSRRVGCVNHLHQIGVAFHAHHDVKGHFPSSHFVLDILPFMGQEDLAKKFSEGITYVPGGSQILEQIVEPTRFYGATFPFYECPSDPAQSVSKGRAVSYFLNTGTGWGNISDGFQIRSRRLAARDVTDGLSNTMAVGERLLYRGHEELGAEGTVFQPTADQRRRRMATTDPFLGTDQREVFADECETSAVWFAGDYGGGMVSTLISGGGHPQSYNHIMTPNKNSCNNGFSNQSKEYAALTATSLHPGGVNILAGDGSVRFVSDHIDRSVWWALGTRSGNETVSVEF